MVGNTEGNSDDLLSRTRPDFCYTQSGVVPYLFENGEIKVCIISNTSKGWIIPKGVIDSWRYDINQNGEKFLPAGAAEDGAAQEAYEEAGLLGVVDEGSIGQYTYLKKRWSGYCTVSVYCLRVLKILDDWEDKGRRKRQFVSIDDAIEMVKYDSLAGLIENHFTKGEKT